MRRVLFVAVLLCTVFLVNAAVGQELASLTGVVSDKTGAVVPDANVKLLDTRTNAAYQTTTNALGAYTFVKLLPGPGYKVTFSKDGFETLTVSDIYVGVGTTHTQNAELQLGKVTETVEVSGQGEVVSLNTTDTVVGKSFDMKAVHDLPIQARETPLALLDLLPGVVDTPIGTSDPNSSRAGAVSGARTDQTNITLDGLDVNDFATGQSFVAVGDAPVDSVQEFRAETANPLAASGRGSGAQVTLATKQGTNAWHGAAFDYLRNTATEANSFFNDRGGVPKPALNRNSFGANLGGPVLRDKLFFFFNYGGRRESVEDSVLATVPLDSFRNGNISYINNGAGCTPSSRINTTPGCITTLSNANVLTQGLDPADIGLNSNLLAFINSRYPHANDLTQGDGVNTGGFRFNSPAHRSINDYVSRVDYNLTSKMKLFGRVSILRDSGDDDHNFAASGAFPGDPVTHQIVDTSYAYVIGHTWTISPTKVNQFYYGETRSQLNFPTLFNPVGALYWQGFGNITTPFFNQQSQHRVIPIPVLRDDFNYIRGTHNLQVGGTFKSIKTTNIQVFDFNRIAMGLGGNLTSLAVSQRPADILQSTLANPGADPQGIATSLWDNSFTLGLGRMSQVFTAVNNDLHENPLPFLTGHSRKYRYRETELYLQDTWRVRSDLTLTYGLRYQYYSVPYETQGFEATPNLNFHTFLGPRVPLGPQGLVDPQPILTYDVAGKFYPNAPSLYHPDWRDFAPRFAIAYNPSGKDGFPGRLLGDRKSVIRAGGGIVFDHNVTNAINFIQDQSNYLFQNSVTTRYNGDLATDPRFVDINTLPPVNPLPKVTPPFQPFFVPGFGGFGTAAGETNYSIDNNLKTPYSITMTFGVQRELPGNFLLDVNYFGRLGRRLLTQSDAGQMLDFTDPVSGHKLSRDFADLSKQLRSGVNPFTDAVTPEPFFENQISPAVPGGSTQFVAQQAAAFVLRGDLSDFVQQFVAFPFFGLPGLQNGLGLPTQFGSAVYVTNQGFSSYNGLLATLHKRMSHNIQFDFNYTFAHSIDNISAPANNVAGTLNLSGGLICDALNLRRCRGDSDFDVRHTISGNAIWELPVGHGQRFASNLPGWANQIIGGWQLSGIPTWNTGFAFTTVSNAFPISFLNNAPAVFIGSDTDLKVHVHPDPSSGAIQLFADPAKARAAFRGPLGLEGGTRNNLRGPGFFNVDMGLAKRFPIAETISVQFRADAFNVFNHVNFSLPGTGGSGGTADITDPSSFGVINSTASPRVMQFALRLEF